MPTSAQQQQQHHHPTNPRSRARVSLPKLGSILPSSSTNLQIKLVEPILYFRGSAQESVGCFLRGDLILNLTKPTKIRKIEIKFAGKMKTYWPEGKLYYGSDNRNELCEEEEIISRSWTVVSPPSLPSGTSSASLSNSGQSSHRFSILRSNSLSSSTSRFHLIPAGTHKYPFELLVPGNIPETVNAERGSVNYKLTATAVRPGLSSNIHVSQHVPIIRTVLEERNSEGIAIASEWNDQLDYEITIPKKAYPMGDSIEIDLKLSPRAKKIKVADVKIQINEQSLYEAKGQKNVRSRTLSVYNVDDLMEQRIMFSKNDLIDNLCEEDFGDSFYHKNILLPIPKCTSPIHCSCETTSIKISHHLKFIFTIRSPLTGNEDDKKRRKKIEVKVDVPVPITILSCRCEDDLPQYEDFEHCPHGEGGNPSSPRIDHNSPSYDFPPSYEQSTDNERDYLRRRSIQEIGYDDVNTITTRLPLERLSTF